MLVKLALRRPGPNERNGGMKNQLVGDIRDFEKMGIRFP